LTSLDQDNKNMGNLLVLRDLEHHSLDRTTCSASFISKASCGVLSPGV